MARHPDQVPKMEKPRNKGNGSEYLRYSGLGIQLAVLIGLAYWLGHKADEAWMGGRPIFSIGFILLVFGASIYKLYKELFK